MAIGHIKVLSALPFFVEFCEQRADQPEHRVLVWEYADHAFSAPNFLNEAFLHLPGLYRHLPEANHGGSSAHGRSPPDNASGRRATSRTFLPKGGATRPSIPRDRGTTAAS